jgi:antitoxin VapB
MAHSTLFKSNRSQAVRIPKDLEFDPKVKLVSIRKIGNTRVVAPINRSWDDFFNSPGVKLPKRAQPKTQKRESF